MLYHIIYTHEIKYIKRIIAQDIFHDWFHLLTQLQLYRCLLKKLNMWQSSIIITIARADLQKISFENQSKLFHSIWEHYYYFFYHLLLWNVYTCVLYIFHQTNLLLQGYEVKRLNFNQTMNRVYPPNQTYIFHGLIANQDGVLH